MTKITTTETRQPGRPRRLTAEDETLALDLRARGFPRTKIAEAIGDVSAQTIGRLIRDHGDPLPPRPKIDAVAIAEEYAAQGETCRRLADRYGVSDETIARAVRAHGKPARRGRPGPRDGRRGRGRNRKWKGEDYDKDALGNAGRAAWPSWLAAMTEEARDHVEAVLLDRSEDALDHAVRMKPRKRDEDDQLDRARDLNPCGVEDAMVEMLDERRRMASRGLACQAKEVRS
jgi:transposase-like protein